MKCSLRNPDEEKHGKTNRYLSNKVSNEVKVESFHFVVILGLLKITTYFNIKY